jgi:uncharacterized phage protein (TIGR01671 family)
MDKFIFRFWYYQNNEMVNDLDFKDSLRNIDWGDFISDGELMLCSGVKDKNKTLIFDGDIVKRQNRYIGVVIFEKGCFKIKWQDGVYYGWARHIDDYQESSLEIIGNIYENPELLEDKNNG